MAITVSVGAEHRSLTRVSEAAARSPATGGDGQTDRLMAIGQVARRSGFTVKALRFYERRGLLPSAGRSPGGYRLYTEADLHRLDFIRQAMVLGLPLDAIRELVEAARERPRGRARLRLLQILAGRIAQTDEQIAMLAHLRGELSRRRQIVARQAPRRPNARGYCTCLRDDPGASGPAAVKPTWNGPASRAWRRR
jgi:DNA-binding transcriptional MerR regulator